MPTNVRVDDLKINKLTKAQYEAAVQGGAIGEYELSIITDASSVDSVNGKSGDVILTYNDVNALPDTTTINDLTTSTQQDALNSGINSNLVNQIGTNQTDISTINEKIPSVASTSNQLADKAFVNSSINNMAAFYITSDALGNAFSTKAALDSGPYYFDGSIRTVTINDYAIVIVDETHNNGTSRYSYTGSQWSFQYLVNDTPFTQAQIDALNSGINSNLVTDYNNHIADTDIHVNVNVLKTELDKKQDTLVSGTNIKTVNNQSVLGSGNLVVDGLPSQASQSGKFLTTNGTAASWVNIPTELPSQSGQNGKYLTTNGTNAAWVTVGVLPSQSGQAGKYLTTNGTNASWATLNIPTTDEYPYQPDLFDFKWSDHILDNASWIRADDFSWYDGNIYTAAYNHLRNEFDITKPIELETINGVTVYFRTSDDGHKIVLADGEQDVINLYNTVGIAWYYILDMGNKRFKLPRTKFGFNGLRNKVGNYIAPGLPNITGTVDTGVGHGHSTGAFYQSSTHTYAGIYANTNYVSGFDASRSSSIYGASTTVQPPATQMYLYFYAGNFKREEVSNEIIENIATTNLSNLTEVGKSNTLLYALGGLQNTDDSKIGYLQYYFESGSAVYAPAGGKWLVLDLMKISNSNGAVFAFSADFTSPVGSIVAGGTQIASARSGYTTRALLLRVE